MPERREIGYSPEISHGEIAPDAGGNVEVLPEIAEIPASEAVAPTPLEPAPLPVKKITQAPKAAGRPLSPMGRIIRAERIFDISQKSSDSFSILEDSINGAREDVRQKFFEKGEAA